MLTRDEVLLAIDNIFEYCLRMNKSTNSTAVPHDCISESLRTSSIIFAIIDFPIYVFVFRVLIIRLQLRMPRHKLLLSLAVSDSMRIVLLALLQLLGSLLHLKAPSMTCQVIRKSCEVILDMTLITESGSILLLSVERYIACAHCFRLQEIITDGLVKKQLCFIWAFGLVGAFIDPKRYELNLKPDAIPLTKAFNILYATTVIACSLIMIFVQARLYLLAYKRSKVRVQPAGNFGQHAEASDLRRTRFKSSLIASAIVVLYMVCMCPLAFYIVANGFAESSNMSDVRAVVSILVEVNTFVNPFVYTLGMSDTRQALQQELRKIKSFFKSLLPLKMAT